MQTDSWPVAVHITLLIYVIIINECLTYPKMKIVCKLWNMKNTVPIKCSDFTGNLFCVMNISTLDDRLLICHIVQNEEKYCSVLPSVVVGYHQHAYIISLLFWWEKRYLFCKVTFHQTTSPICWVLVVQPLLLNLTRAPSYTHCLTLTPALVYPL